MKRSSPSSLSNGFRFTPNAGGALRLNLVEGEFQKVACQMQERFIHRRDRPEIETRILTFLERAQGPTTEGIAAEMGVSRSAAAFHLQELSKAGRVWQQTVHSDATWRVTLEGRHYLADHRLPQTRKDWL